MAFLPATHSASCAGLTRASMMRSPVYKPYCFFLLHLIMDCRVKPGNDSGEVKTPNATESTLTWRPPPPSPRKPTCKRRAAGTRSRSRSGSRRCCRSCCSPIYLSLASQIAITAMFALSLDLILGYAGIVSLGHAAFFGFGAYTAGLISKFGWGEPFSGLILGGGGRRARRLCHELHRLALPPSRADHDHARARPACSTRRRTARAGSPAATTACKA